VDLSIFSRGNSSLPGMRTIRTAAAIAAGSLAIASCGGSFSTSSSGTSKAAAAKPGGILTFGVPSAPATLDPAKDVWATYSVMRYLSNEPLLSLDSRTGAIGPGLATSYSYVGTRNMGFQFTLRGRALRGWQPGDGIGRRSLASLFLAG
jgi:ABC-type transport system substrate-binding protein